MMILKLFKKVDSCGKIFIPKNAIERFGKEFFMEIYEDKIVLMPTKKKN